MLEQYFALLVQTLNNLDFWLRSLNITIGGVQIGLYQIVGFACVSAIIKTLLGTDDESDDLGGGESIDI